MKDQVLEHLAFMELGASPTVVITQRSYYLEAFPLCSAYFLKFGIPGFSILGFRRRVSGFGDLFRPHPQQHPEIPGSIVESPL